MHRDIILAAASVIAPVVGAVISLVEQVEAWLRVGSMLIGIVTGVISLLILMKKYRRDK